MRLPPEAMYDMAIGRTCRSRPAPRIAVPSAPFAAASERRHNSFPYRYSLEVFHQLTL